MSEGDGKERGAGATPEAADGLAMSPEVMRELGGKVVELLVPGRVRCWSC